MEVTIPELAIEILVDDARTIRVNQSRVVETAMAPDGTLLVDTSGFAVDVDISFRFILSSRDVVLLTAGSFDTVEGE